MCSATCDNGSSNHGSDRFASTSDSNSACGNTVSVRGPSTTEDSPSRPVRVNGEITDRSRPTTAAMSHNRRPAANPREISSRSAKVNSFRTS